MMNRNGHDDPQDCTAQLAALRLLEQTGEITNGLPPLVVSHFFRLRARYPGREGPVTAIRNGMCKGCYQVVPTAVFQVVRQQRRLITCENCGRFLISAE